jgi:hypothetical protein
MIEWNIILYLLLICRSKTTKLLDIIYISERTELKKLIMFTEVNCFGSRNCSNNVPAAKFVAS